ncbi:hypothetical protein [Burkholderia ubonensis]|uniref:hypothetical protein n=1 Tax=Burkholderia ubonensis TaxID=101571 RepID=UPI0012F7724D|nr:hypothetical protein [Burkholderia ubonensis]
MFKSIALLCSLTGWVAAVGLFGSRAGLAASALGGLSMLVVGLLAWSKSTQQRGLVVAALAVVDGLAAYFAYALGDLVYAGSLSPMGAVALAILGIASGGSSVLFAVSSPEPQSLAAEA